MRRRCSPIVAAFLVAVFSSLIGVRQVHALTYQEASRLITTAASGYLGVPYLWGGTTMRGIDCSGLTQACYRNAGWQLPRTAAEQARTLRMCSTMPGALIFFACDDKRPGVVTHVGIIIDGDWMIDANSAAGKVKYDNWRTNNYWRARFVTAGFP